MYSFLAAVADKHGLSFYSDGTLVMQLRMTLSTLVEARDELLARDLIVYKTRSMQVLSLPPYGQERRYEPSQGTDGTRRHLTASHGIDASKPGRNPAMNVALWAESVAWPRSKNSPVG